jgi:hypothetical protein
MLARSVDLTTPRGKAQAAKARVGAAGEERARGATCWCAASSTGSACGKTSSVRARRGRRDRGQPDAGPSFSGPPTVGARWGAAPGSAPAAPDPPRGPSEGQRPPFRAQRRRPVPAGASPGSATILTVAEIVDVGLASVWREMLAVVASGEGLTVEVSRTGSGRSGGVLAGLLDDLPFEDWVPDACGSAATRARDARLQAVLQVFAPSSAPQDGGSGLAPDLRPGDRAYDPSRSPGTAEPPRSVGRDPGAHLRGQGEGYLTYEA